MSRKVGVRTALFAALAVVSLSATAQTTTPANGLGQSWPNATDVSQNPNYHVYVFQLNGVKYIQVNDLNGVVHAAIGVVSGTPFALPIGSDAQNVTTATSTTTTSAPASSSSSAGSAAVTVYSDADTTVTAAPASTTTDAPASSSSTSSTTTTTTATSSLKVNALVATCNAHECSTTN